jgi:hypothetical protein
VSGKGSKGRMYNGLDLISLQNNTVITLHVGDEESGGHNLAFHGELYGSNALDSDWLFFTKSIDHHAGLDQLIIRFALTYKGFRWYCMSVGFWNAISQGVEVHLGYLIITYKRIIYGR